MTRWRLLELSVACSLMLFPAIAGAQYARYPILAGEERSFPTPVVPDWISVDASFRDRIEHQSNINFRQGDSPLYDLTRVRVGFHFHPSVRFNAYVQMQDSHALALSPKDVSPSMRDTFDVRQALISVKGAYGQMIVGRQPLRFADERLIGVSDWTNVSRTFDGIVLTRGVENRVTLFSATVVNIYPGRPDRSDGGLHLHGAVVALEGAVPHTSIQPFLYVKTTSGVNSPLQRNGRDITFSFGSFVAGDLPKNFFYSATGVLQRGGYAGQSVSAGAGFFRFGYTAHALPLMPEVSVEYDYASGSDGSRIDRHSTFDQLYPSNHAVFGLTDLFGWQNIKQRRVGLTVLPRKGLSVSAASSSLHLAQKGDAIFGGSGAPLVNTPAAGFVGDGIGTEADLSMKYAIGDFVTNAGVGHFFPGVAMTSTGKGAPLTIGFLSFTYRFSLKHAAEGMRDRSRKMHHVPQAESDDH